MLTINSPYVFPFSQPLVLPLSLDQRTHHMYHIGIPIMGKENNMQAVLQIYDAKVDSRKRITLRNAKYDYYNVQELEDGRIIMEPRVLTPPFEISANTLSMMDSSIKNMKSGNVSKPIDLSEFMEG